MKRISVILLVLLAVVGMHAQERLTPCKSRDVATTERRAGRLSRARASSTYAGEKRGLVILVSFSDFSLTDEDTAQEYYYRSFNEKGFADNGHAGSVADYFYDQSYGQLSITFDVVGPVTLSQSIKYYGENDSSGSDKHVCELVIEACEMIDDEVDFSLYDWDGDGEVDQVFLIYAGYGENFSGASSYCIWPHEWQLSSGKSYSDGSGAQTYDGVKVDTYAMSCELFSYTGTTRDGIGTACHEFAHCLGYPDFYDTSYNGGWGMQAWDVMDSGCYNGDNCLGTAPIGMTAYERWYAGWLEPTTLEDGMTVDDLPALADAPVAYALYNDKNANEYYLLANYQADDKWFSYVSGYTAPSGMMILHVDYNASVWANNKPNNSASHQRMTPFLANNAPGTYSSSGGYYTVKQKNYMGHLYPYEANDSLTANSTPAATLFNTNTAGTKYMQLGIYNIAQNSDGTMSFYCGEQCPATEEDDEDEDTDDGDDGDGITTLREEALGAGRVYDLYGRVVSTPTRGLYIRNGRKVIIK